MRLISLKQKGDTIVEVLICMAAVSAVFGAAFVTINRSVITGRQAQERVEALKHVEAQIEILKSFTTPGDKYAFGASSFCYHVHPDNSITREGISGGVAASADGDDLRTGGTYPDKCVLDFYNMSISRTDNTFNVRARWDSASGRGRDEVSILYRIYPGQ